VASGEGPPMICGNPRVVCRVGIAERGTVLPGTTGGKELKGFEGGWLRSCLGSK
jgi:hypothetical protein